MSGVLPNLPPLASYAALRRLSVGEYNRMIRAGILDEDDAVELLEGYMVLKMPHNPPHDGTIQRVRSRLPRHLPAGWDVRVQSSVELPDSVPEPDLAVARGDDSTYLARHPTPADVGLLIEVSDSTLTRDRDDKGRIYARAGIPAYWIVNLVDRQLEVYSAPSGPTASPGYAQRQVHVGGASVPLELDGVVVAWVPVADLVP